MIQPDLVINITVGNNGGSEVQALLLSITTQNYVFGRAAIHQVSQPPINTDEIVARWLELCPALCAFTYYVKAHNATPLDMNIGQMGRYSRDIRGGS